MKKIILAIYSIFMILFFIESAYGVCQTITDGGYISNVSTMIRGCYNNSDGFITTKNGDYSIGGGVKARVISVADNLIIAGALLAIGGIIYAAILFSLSLGSDEKVKSAKEAAIWSALGFLLMILAYPVVNAVINLIYDSNLTQ